jgi:hypothetical protein
MKIRNLTTKAIGFGTVTVYPDKTGDTPKGFGKGHPVVDYYLSRGWIEELDAAPAAPAPAVADGLGVSLNAGGSTGETTGTGAAGKPIDRMNKEELTALAAELGVEVTEADTKQMILDKVRAAKKADE